VDEARLDDSTLKVAGEVPPGETFRYTFDLGDDWRHTCRVSDEKVDPSEEWVRHRASL
jgi:hypothetical protein